MFPSIPLIQQLEFKLEQLQKNIVLPLNNLFSKNPMIDGVLLTDVTLVSSGTTSVQHKLKRSYQGFLITKINANSVVWVGSTTEAETYIKLNCTANCTVDIWVF